MKKPIWRERRGEFPWFVPSYRARLNGWVLTVRESVKPFSGVRTGEFTVFAQRASEVYNSAWPEYNCHWDTLAAAQAAAETFARERKHG